MNFKAKFTTIMIVTMASMLSGTWLIGNENSVFRLAGSVPMMVSVLSMIWLVLNLSKVNNYSNPIDQKLLEYEGHEEDILKDNQDGNL